MTDPTTPIGAAFELQRQSIRRSGQFLRTGLRIQGTVAESILQNGVAVQRNAQRQGTELTRQAFDAQRDAFAFVLGPRREAETEPAKTVRPTGSAVTDVRPRAEGDAGTVRQEADATVLAPPQATGTVIETTPESARDDTAADDTLEDLAVDTTSAIEAASERASDPESVALLDLEDVGRAYVEGLEAAGIETLADLARTQANTVAEAAGVSQVRATDWIRAARLQT